MKKFTQVLAIAATGLWFVAPVSAQLGLGGGGNAGAGVDVGNAVQGVTQGVGNATRNVQQGARNIQRGVRQLGSDTVQLTRQGLQNQTQNLRNTLPGQQRFDGRIGANASTFVDVDTPQIPARAQADAEFNAQADRDARWRKIRHNGEWWYYSPEGNWMYMRDGQWNRYDDQNFQRPNADGTYTANYRDGSSNGDMWRQDGRSVYRLQTDSQGRQYIRLNGQQIWVGSDAGASVRAGQSDSNSRNLEAGIDADASVGAGQSN